MRDRASAANAGPSVTIQHHYTNTMPEAMGPGVYNSQRQDGANATTAAMMSSFLSALGSNSGNNGATMAYYSNGQGVSAMGQGKTCYNNNTNNSTGGGQAILSASHMMTAHALNGSGSARSPSLTAYAGTFER